MTADPRTVLQAEYYELTRTWRELIGQRKRALRAAAPADPQRDAQIAALDAERARLIDRLRAL